MIPKLGIPLMGILCLWLCLLLPQASAESWAEDISCEPCRCYIGRARELRVPFVKKADCSARNLQLVPIHLPADIDYLDLSDNKLSAISSKTFWSYPELKVLRLQMNNLTTLPDDLFTNAPLLQYLNLHGNHLVRIDASIFQNASHLSTLKGLSVDYLPPTLFHGLGRLRDLSVSTHELHLYKGVFDSLQLRHLHIEVPEAKTLPPSLFHSCNSTLLDLMIKGKKLELLDAGLLTNLTILRRVYLELENMSFLPGSIFNGMKLEKDAETDLVSIVKELYEHVLAAAASYRHGLRDITVIGVNELPRETFQQLPNLLNIKLKKVEKIHPELFKMLARLDNLDMSNNHITDLHASWFSDLKGIKQLNLSRNAIRMANASYFENLFSLVTLDLSHNEIKQLQPRMFSAFHSTIESLDLSHNSICDLPPGIFASMWMLRTLNLDHNCLQVPEKSVFLDLEYLEELHLENNHITVINEQLFLGLKDLAYLNISNNNIKELEPSTLLDTTSLRIFDLSNNTLESVPAELIPDHNHLELLATSGNPLHCNCTPAILNLMEMAHKQSSVESGICIAPVHLVNRSLDNITTHDICPLLTTTAITTAVPTSKPTYDKYNVHNVTSTSDKDENQYGSQLKAPKKMAKPGDGVSDKGLIHNVWFQVSLGIGIPLIMLVLYAGITKFRNHRVSGTYVL